MTKRVRRLVRRTFFLPVPFLLASTALAGNSSGPAARGQAEAVEQSPRSPAERVADVGFRLALAGLARCPRTVPSLGLTFQHLGQFEPADRATLLKTVRLDLGPSVLAVAQRSPAASAQILPGDILLAINGAPLPPPEPIDRPFDQDRARARADAIDDQAEDAAAPVRLSLLRGDRQLTVTFEPVRTCPSRIHLARAKKQNAFADGTHVLITTGLLERLRSDDELAFVLGHEMAHNILQHAAMLRAEGVPRGMTRVLGRNGQLVRATEREADLVGGQLVLDAGYDLYAGAAVLKSLDEGPGIAFLSAHDATAKRIAAVRALIGQRSGLAAGRTQH